MNDNPDLETFLNFNATKPKRRENCFEAVFNTPERTQNQKILDSFKQLRHQLKVSQRENEQLKQELKISEIKLRQSQQQLEIMLQTNLSIKTQLKKQSQSNEELKQKLFEIKESLTKTKTLEDQLQFTKQALLESRFSQQNNLTEKKKIMEMSLNDKMKLEEQILKRQAKAKSDEKYLRQIQNELTQTKSLNIKLENQLRKYSISHEEEIFNKQWSLQNYQTQHLLQKIQELEKQLSSAKGKYKKEKEKKLILQQKLLEFQQLSGVNQLKAEAFQSEAELLINRQGKLQKKIANLTKKLQANKEESLLTSTKLANLSMAAEDFICKVRVEKASNILECVFEFQEKLKTFTNSITAASTLKQSSETQQNLREFSQSYYSQKINTGYLNSVQNYSKQLPIADKNSFLSRFSFGLEQHKENEAEEYADIQNKIRRERDEMERRIKQKYMQKKIEVSIPSETHKLRGEYINNFISRR